MPSRRPFLVFYAASGAAALVYEVVWTRLLTLVMGHTVAAASTVLAAIMGGLAFGAWLGARIERDWAPAERARRALGAYATLEIAIALFALALPVLLSACAPLLAWAYADGHAPVRFGLTRAALCALLVGVPATAMGATFPFAVSVYARAAADAGILYAVNSAGAALGALLTGFWLIPTLGLRRTTAVGVVLNFVAAAGARWFAGRTTQAAATPRAAPSAKGSQKRQGAKTALLPVAPVAPRIGLVAAALSGACALVYQVVWTRLVALVVGPTTYAFATVVAAFIVGIAIGSAVASKIVARTLRPAARLAETLLFAALAAAVAGSYAATRLPFVVAQQVTAADAAFTPIVAQQAATVLLLLLPLSCALGAAFTFAVAAATPVPSGIDASAARVYTWNTVGAIAGAITAGFVLLPALGLYGSQRVATTVGWLAAAGVWIADIRARHAGERSPMRSWIVPGASLAAVGAVVALLPAWDPQLLSGGTYKYAQYIGIADLDDELHVWDMRYHRDGSTATVSVRELAGQRSLVIDGKVDASNTGDMLTQRMLGLLPVLMHDAPKDVLVLGLGSGVTVGATLAPGSVRSADVVEISPEVVEASAYFGPENGDVLRAPGVRLLVGDGRSHLAFTTRTYDVIVSEPSNPWMAGIAPLFTREFFGMVRSRLAPGGVACQWAHTYDISRDDLRSIVRTFSDVFPQSTMWLVGDGDLLLIGTNGPSVEALVDGLPARLDRGTTRQLLAGVGAGGGTAAFAVLSMLAGGPAEVARYAEGATVQADDLLRLEFSAPRALYGRSTVDNAREIRQIGRDTSVAAARRAWRDADDVALASAATMLLRGDGYDAAVERFQQALRKNSSNIEALSGLTDAANGAGRPDEARVFLEQVAGAEPSNAAVRTELSRYYAATGDLERAATLAASAMQLAPADPRHAEQLASVFADARDVTRLGELAVNLATQFPDRDRPRYFKAFAAMLENRPADAIGELRTVVTRSPSDARSQNLLGVACAATNDRSCALAAFEAALAAGPRAPDTLINLGVFHLQTDPAKAKRAFQTALTVDRTSAAARQGLAEARAALGGR